MLVTIPLIGLALFYQESLAQSTVLQHIVAIAIPASALYAVFCPPNSTPFVKYAQAFISVAYVLRAIELLLAHDLLRLERLERRPSPRPIYIWQPIPRAHQLSRLLYICDLLVNPRAIGWSYGSSAYLPPTHQIEEKDRHRHHHHHHRHSSTHSNPPQQHDQTRGLFLAKQVFTILYTYLLFDLHQSTFGRNLPRIRDMIIAAADHFLDLHISPATGETLTRMYLLGPFCWIAAYSFIEGIHAVIALLDVGLLRPVVSVGNPGEPWMYPPLFRSVRYLFTCRLRDIWGKMWHDLCRRPLLAVSLLLTPASDTVSPILHRFLLLCVSFTVSGTFHAAGAYAVSQDPVAAAMMMIFFIVLALCIALQQLLTLGMARVVGPGWTRNVLTWWCDAVVLVAWAFYTCPWFIRYSMLPEAIASMPLPGSVGRVVWGW